MSFQRLKRCITTHSEHSMSILNLQTKSNWNSSSLHPITQASQLSPVTRYYICKLLRQISSAESSEFLEFKSKLSFNQCTPLDEILQQRYPDEVELSQISLQLENLVNFYMTLNFQSASNSDSSNQLTQIKQKILQLLGFIHPDR